jgi:hypothetical protein
MPFVVNKTVKPTGGDYVSLAALAADVQDLVSADEQWDVVCDNFEDTEPATFSGWTTDSTRFIRVKASTLHHSRGPITDQAYRLVCDTTCVHVLGAMRVLFETMQIECTSSADKAVDIGDIPGDLVRFYRSVLRSQGIGIDNRGDTDLQMINVIAKCVGPCVQRAPGGDLQIYSSTLITTGDNQDCASFGSNDASLREVWNSYASVGAGGGSAWAGAGIDKHAAASSDTSGTFGFRNVAYDFVTFVGIDDLRLVEGSPLAEAGDSRASLISPFNYDVDVEGNARPDGEEDIGAYEIVVELPHGNELLVQDDFGSVVGAVAYIDRLYLLDYFTARGIDLSSYTDEALEAAIVKATDYLDQRFQFVGFKARLEQRTKWPRIAAEDVDGWIRTGIPVEIKEATAEYARIALTVTLNPTPTRDASGALITSISKTVGPISKSVTFAGSGSFQLPSYPVADSRLKNSGLVSGGKTLRLH